MTLSDLANLVEIFGALAIIFGIAFGVIQLRQHRKQVRSTAILELARSFEDREFTEAYRLIADLDDGVSSEQLNALGEKYVSAALRVGFKFETVGVLIHKKVVPMDAMTDLVGGAAVLIWAKLETWVEESRVSQDHKLLFEWFQWLAEQLEARGEDDRDPAYQLHRDWREPR